MRPRTLLVLFAVVVVLAAFIWFIERDLPSTEERLERGRKLLVLDPDEVKDLTLEVGDRVVRLERSGPESGSNARWTLTEPPLGRADADEVEDLLRTLEDLEKERTLDDGSRDELGLASPRAEIRIGAGADATSMRLGSRVPASENALVEIGSGPPFYVVSDSAFEAVFREPDEWRSRDAIAVERESIRRIEILVPANGVILERGAGAGEGFRMIAPVDDAVDRNRVSDLLASLVDLEIEEFVDDSGSVPELGAPAASLRLAVDGRSEPITVAIGTVDKQAAEDGATGASDSKETYSVRVDGQTFRARTELAAILAVSAAEWQSPKWSDRRAFEIDGVRVQHEGSELVLERREGKWLRAGEEVRYSIVDGFLRAITEAVGVPVQASQVEGDEPRQAVLEILFESSEGEERLRLSRADADYLAQRDGRTVLLRMDAGSITALLGTLEDVETAAPVEAPEADDAAGAVDH